VIHGDGISFSIAASSVIAKVHRDRSLVELESSFPAMGWRSTKATLARRIWKPWSG
jgi:ribonuclease HII